MYEKPVIKILLSRETPLRPGLGPGRSPDVGNVSQAASPSTKISVDTNVSMVDGTPPPVTKTT